MGRVQSVKVNNFISAQFGISSGVPQGSHCAPLLFNLFVNDLMGVINYSTFSMFADDLKLYKNIEQCDDTLKLQSDLDALWNWSSSNNLSLNIKKCCCISFFSGRRKHNIMYTINNEDLQRVTIVKDLGVWFDEKLSFTEHISRICSKSFSVLGFVARNSDGLSLDATKLLFTSLVRSNLEYSSVVWNPQYRVHMDCLERVQSKFLRVMAYKLHINFDQYHRSDMLHMLGLDTLEVRRVRFDMCFVFKLVNGLTDCPRLLSRIGFNTPRRDLRNFCLFNIPFHSTKYGQHSPIDRTLRTLNNLNIDVFGCTLSGFKQQLKGIDVIL